MTPANAGPTRGPTTTPLFDTMIGGFAPVAVVRRALHCVRKRPFIKFRCRLNAYPLGCDRLEKAGQWFQTKHNKSAGLGFRSQRNRRRGLAARGKGILGNTIRLPIAARGGGWISAQPSRKRGSIGNYRYPVRQIDSARRARAKSVATITHLSHNVLLPEHAPDSPTDVSILNH